MDYIIIKHDDEKNPKSSSVVACPLFLVDKKMCIIRTDKTG